MESTTFYQMAESRHHTAQASRGMGTRRIRGSTWHMHRPASVRPSLPMIYELDVVDSNTSFAAQTTPSFLSDKDKISDDGFFAFLSTNDE